MKRFREIVIAIEKYKKDIVDYPIFFTDKNLTYLESEEALNNISQKLQDIKYQPEFPETYKIPYDAISTRLAHNLQIDDIIIRYFILNELQKDIEVYVNQTNPKDFKVYCIIDIYDCYNQIKSDVFLETLKNEFTNKIDEDLFNLISRSLNYKNLFSKKDNGLLVGSKPDEFFAELFLSIIHSKLNIKVSENISRLGDEFLICGDSIGELRNYLESIEEILFTEYSLKINKSKSNVKFTSEKRNITRVIPYEEPWPYTSPSCPPPMYPKILYKELNYTINHKDLESHKDFNRIDSYKKSIEYLKLITPEIEKIEIYTKKTPGDLSLFAYWNSSTPTETKQLYQNIDFETILNPNVLDKLETIIYRFPRSQYFSHLAVKNLCIYAKNFYYSDDESTGKNDNNAFIVDNIDFSKVNPKNSTFLCEKSNSILLNAIRSNDIYDYQKYLILRELYLDRKNLTTNLDNFKIKGSPPFDILIQNELKKISESYWELELPFQTIINELIN